MSTWFPFIEPQACFKRAIRPTLRNILGQHVMATRKQFDPFHEIKYTYDSKSGPLSARQFRIIDNHCASMSGGVTPFNVVDWSDTKLVKAINSKGYITLNNVKGLSENAGDGGNRIILWAMDGDYGNDSTVSGNTLTDTRKAWTTDQWTNYKLMDTNGRVFNATSAGTVNTGQTITLTKNATIHPGAYEIFRYESHLVTSVDENTRVVTVNGSIDLSYSAFKQVLMPVYKCFYAMDSLGLEPTGEFNLESSDHYGPFYAGEITFIQKGTN